MFKSCVESVNESSGTLVPSCLALHQWTLLLRARAGKPKLLSGTARTSIFGNKVTQHLFGYFGVEEVSPDVAVRITKSLFGDGNRPVRLCFPFQRFFKKTMVLLVLRESAGG